MYDYDKRNGRITALQRSQTLHDFPLLDPNRQDNALTNFELFAVLLYRFKPRSTRSDPMEFALGLLAIFSCI